MQTTPSIAALAAALSKAQGDFPAIPKGKTAKAGPYSYDYADLADMISALQPVLAANGLAVVQSAGCEADKDGSLWVHASTIVMHSSGEWFQTSPLQVKVEGNKPQSVGIATTYARRYSYGAALGVSPDADTDGKEDHQTETKPPRQTAPKPPTQAAPKGPTIADRKAAAVKALHALGYTDDGIKMFVPKLLGHPFNDKTTDDIQALENEISLMQSERQQNVQ